ncbi:hypothetical protein [Caulobacter sp. 17J65-9]|uniref:hypothetical protein n=1 Tax=Caulobacter sp. 17J65-9 TaxID=2709382 RepID=UPI0013C6398D|nr:hypothetical protein [Caulobacter sp. 17J65-9]NEX91333.1 hypothetical protein [Caulobacter sp. 17J65-9]
MASKLWAAFAVVLALAGAQPAAAQAEAKAWSGRDYVCFWDAYWASRPESARQAFLSAEVDDLEAAASTLFSDGSGVAAAARSCARSLDDVNQQDAVRAIGISGLLTYSENKLIVGHGLTRARLDTAFAALPSALVDRLSTLGSPPTSDDDAAAERGVDAFGAALGLPASQLTDPAVRQDFAFYVLGRAWRTRLTG